ncbi:MAG: molybdate transport system permease protein [Actinomycetota bacterium]|jgi:molybdate transport system permease protein|nr:molybdate transport system permease protein [Actinomycetota bacterium]
MRTRAGSAVVIVAAAVGGLVFVVPVAGLVWRAPWWGLWASLSSSAAREALRLSVVCSLWATAVCVMVGLPLAWVLARVPFPGRRLVRALVLVPLVLPPVVGGVALLLAFGRRGLAGVYLDRWFGITLPFTTAGSALAEAFVALPFLVLTAESAFRSADRRLEEAARTLGAGPWTVFRRVTLPLAAPALGAGAVLAWARALGEFGATITFAGNSPGRTTTIPIQVYLLLESGDVSGAIALSLVLLGVAVAVLAVLRDRWVGGWSSSP